jgi:nitrilase
MGLHARDKLAAQERDGDGPQQAFLSRARTRAFDPPDRRQRAHRERRCGAREANRCSCTGPDGVRVAPLRQDPSCPLHARRRGLRRGEDDRGRREPRWFTLPYGRVGLSICYDLRFPELFRALGDMVLLVVPAAFTRAPAARTGRSLLRARAIENQCYVLAAAQTGTHPGGRRTWGHSMLVDPWGDVVAVRPEGEGSVVGDVDPARLADVRCAATCALAPHARETL